jgi:alpha-mannosidase
MMTKKTLSRRNFIRRTAVGAGMLALSPANSLLARPAKNKWPRDAQKFTVYMIGHGHIDPVWLWNYSEGIAVVHSTFRSALDRMNETAEVVFTSTSAQFYQWVADNDPSMLAEIRQRVAEGRWNVAGGWWVEPDVNIPSGEALVRQGLYGQHTLQQLVGRRATVGFNPDSFGHAGTVPQILKLQGMDAYVFSRPGGGEKNLPGNIFWWEGPDGSQVLAYRAPHGYGSDCDDKELAERVTADINVARNNQVPVIMDFFGVGDHGGGPTRRAIRAILKFRQEKDAPRVEFSSMDDYFKALRAAQTPAFPVVKDDLQHHAPGCYTSECAIKKNNRQSENILVTAEKIALAGSVCWGAHYPQERFTDAWKKLLFLQFHDSLPGTSLIEHSRDARDSYGHVMHTARDAMYMALQKLEWQIPSETPGKYVVVFNPHAWPVKQVIEFTPIAPPHGTMPPFPSRFVDNLNRQYPHQWERGQSQTNNRLMTALVEVELPAMGYVQFRETVADSAPVFEKTVKVDSNGMENEYLKVTFAPDGRIRIFDKENRRSVFAGDIGGCGAIVIDDPYDTWGHDVFAFDKEIGAFGKAKINIIETGPLRAKIRTTSTYGQSTLTIDWWLVAGSREVGANVELDWHERQKMLKFSFPVNVASPVATYETPYGFIVRETNGAEDPGQRWIDLTGQKDGKACGLTLINDAKYGYSVNGNDLRISVTRSTVYAHHDPVQIDPDDPGYVWMEQGIQTFRLLLVPHRDDWRAINAPRMAEEFMSPPIPFYQGIHPGHRPLSASFLEMDVSNVIVSAIKKAEDNDDVIIRLVETHGKDTDVALRFPSAAFGWNGHIRGCEIKTLRLNTQTGDSYEVNLLEEQ